MGLGHELGNADHVTVALDAFMAPPLRAGRHRGRGVGAESVGRSATTPRRQRAGPDGSRARQAVPTGVKTAS